MRFTFLAILLVLSGVSYPEKAAADDLFEFWGAGKLGGALGNGDSGSDFYDWASGGAVGFEAGARIWILGAYVEYLRFFGGDVGADLWSINLGGDNEFRFGESWGLVLRLAGSYYFGSLEEGTRVIDGAQVRSAWVDTRGVGFRAGIGPRFHFARYFSVGVTPQVGYHAFFAGADEAAPAGFSSESDGWDLQVMGYLRFGIGF